MNANINVTRIVGNLKYRVLIVMLSTMLVVLFGIMTQQAHAFEGCPEGYIDVEPTIDQSATLLMVEEINKRRAELGVPPMKLAQELVDSATYHAIDMQEDDYFKRGTYDRNTAGALVFQCGVYKRIAQFYGDGTVESLNHAQEMIASGDFDNSANSVNDVLTSMEQVGQYPKLMEGIAREFGMGYAPDPVTGFQKWVLTVGRRDGLPLLIINGEAATVDTNEQNVNLYVWGEWDEIRLRNSNGSWGEWDTFTNSIEDWPVGSRSGTILVEAQVRDTNGGVYTISDSIYREPPTGHITPEICVELQGERTEGMDEPIAYHLIQTHDSNGRRARRPHNAGIIPAIATIHDEFTGCFDVAVPAGTYEIYFVNDEAMGYDYLIAHEEGVSVADSSTIDLSSRVVLLEGDADSNNAVTLADLSIHTSSFNPIPPQSLCEGDMGYDARADFNEDGCVRLSDLSLHTANFNPIPPQAIKGDTYPY